MIDGLNYTRQGQSWLLLINGPLLCVWGGGDTVSGVKKQKGAGFVFVCRN